jgi:undecaprenyl-diphosphatase
MLPVMIETLNNIDQQWLLWLNGHHSPFFDQVMYFVSGKYEWIPLYAVIHYAGHSSDDHPE